MVDAFAKTVIRSAGSIPAYIALRRALLSTGSRIHPWLYAVARYAGCKGRVGRTSLIHLPPINEGLAPINTG